MFFLLAGHPCGETQEELAQGQLRQHHQVRELEGAHLHPFLSHEGQGIILPSKSVLTEQSQMAASSRKIVKSQPNQVGLNPESPYSFSLPGWKKVQFSEINTVKIFWFPFMPLICHNDIFSLKNAAGFSTLLAFQVSLQNM